MQTLLTIHKWLLFYSTFWVAPALICIGVLESYVKTGRFRTIALCICFLVVITFVVNLGIWAIRDEIRWNEKNGVKWQNIQ